MATDPSFAEFVVDQLSACGVTCRKMFGEYALYAGDTVVALICDNRLFVKPTKGGRALIGNPAEVPPYPGAKASFLIEDRIDDRVWLTELVRITATELPASKPKPKPKTKTKVKAKVKAKANPKTRARPKPTQRRP